MGMGSFAKSTMWLLREMFCMPEEWKIFDADADDGRFLLERVMERKRRRRRANMVPNVGICRCSEFSRVRTYIC